MSEEFDQSKASTEAPSSDEVKAPAKKAAKKMAKKVTVPAKKAVKKVAAPAKKAAKKAVTKKSVQSDTVSKEEAVPHNDLSEKAQEAARLEEQLARLKAEVAKLEGQVAAPKKTEGPTSEKPHPAKKAAKKPKEIEKAQEEKAEQEPSAEEKKKKSVEDKNDSLRPKKQKTPKNEQDGLDQQRPKVPQNEISTTQEGNVVVTKETKDGKVRRISHVKVPASKKSEEEAESEEPPKKKAPKKKEPAREKPDRSEKSEKSEKSNRPQSPEEENQIQTVKEDPTPPPPPPEVPEAITMAAIRAKSLPELYEMAQKLPVRIPPHSDRTSLVVLILSCYLKYGTRVEMEGILEQTKENYGMLRDEKRSFKTCPDDVYVPGHMLKECDARVGQRIKVLLRAPRERDNYLSAVEVLEIEGIPRTDYRVGKPFDTLTSLFPEERFLLDGGTDSESAVRVVDLVAPLGKGQRGIIVAPPRGGKTILLKQLAKAIQKNNPETELIVLLLDERPEEVTDFEETVGGNVYASTFDEPSKRHAQVSDIVLERARRLVEQGKDVIILLDSLTRLARGYNNAISGGPIGSGGLSPRAITETRKFFGAARKVEEGGSLTILATCLIETESRLDDIIFEELKGTGNMEVRLDRILAEQRIYPAIHIPQSGTRNDDRLYHPDEFAKIVEIRRHLATMPVGEALETLLKLIAKTGNNTELLLKKFW